MVLGESKRSSKRKQWEKPMLEESPREIRSNQEASRERITLAKSPVLQTKLRAERKVRLDFGDEEVVSSSKHQRPD